MPKTIQKTLIICLAVLMLAGCISPGVFADYEAAEVTPDAEEDCTQLICTEVSLYANGKDIGSALMIGDTTYVPLVAFLEYVTEESADTSWDCETGAVSVAAGGLFLSLMPGNHYSEANGRIFFLEDGFYIINGVTMFPIRVLAELLTLNVYWNEEALRVDVGTARLAPISGGEDYYDGEALYWLSHVIFAEAGNQPLEGMIGVGNVVLNRADPVRTGFPNSIEGVIFQQGQFDVIASGTIYCDPNPQSVIAAKLCLEGCSLVGDALFFVNPKTGNPSWFKAKRTFVVSIADHDFYA